MPEGDTVWRTARRLRALDRQVLTRTDFRIPAHATADLTGATVITTVPRGKHLLTRLDNDITIHSHLGMDGSWIVQARGDRWPRPAHLVRVVLETPADQAIGAEVSCSLVRTADETRVVGHLGPDLLGEDWDAAEALRRLRESPHVPIAVALLDQRNLAGIGNVYKNEVCFICGVAPATPVELLDDATLATLIDTAHRLLNANRDRPVRDTTGGRVRGGWVYRRRGSCVRCGTPLRYGEIGDRGTERATWWCPTCQPPMIT